MKRLLFSITRKDFERQTFSVGGHGGGGKDTSNSGVRLIHRPSGAVGEGREHRRNFQNERAAFLRLIETKEWKRWFKAECARRLGMQEPESPEEIRARVDREVDEGLKNGTVRVEEYQPGSCTCYVEDWRDVDLLPKPGETCKVCQKIRGV